MEIRPDPIDQETCAYYLQVPRDQIVLLQAYFELYEGLGLVRTLDVKASLVCVLTTPSLSGDCERALQAVRGQIPWQPVSETDRLRQSLVRGDFQKTISIQESEYD